VSDLPPAGSAPDRVDQIISEVQDQATPVDATPTDPPPSVADGGASGALAILQRRTPFLDLFCSVAVRVSPDGPPAVRIATMRRAHPWLFGLCWMSDFLIRAVVTLLLIGVLAAVAWKTLAPLPEW
jgi:hypothetical protein